MTCEKTKRFFAKAKFITLEIFDYHQKFFQCCLGIKHSSFPKRNSFLLVKRFGSHFGSQKTTTKIGAAKLPTFPNFVAVWSSFYPQATAHAATHTTLVSSETAPRLFQACGNLRLHRGGPIVRPLKPKTF